MTLVYDDGVFKPAGDVPSRVKNHSTVRVLIVDEVESTGAEGMRAEESVSDGWTMIQRLKGCITETEPAEHVARDHDDHLYGR